MNESDLRMALFGASIDPRLPVVDLHAAGDLQTALYQLDHGLDQAVRSGARACRVIYGLGEGVLAREVRKRLSAHPQVLGFKEEESGGSSVIVF